MSLDNRRPLASRSSNWAQNTAKALVKSNVTPNQISISAMGFALLGGLSFYFAGQSSWTAPLLLIGAAFCQMRLLCNLFDGMVAIEGGKAEPDGPFWNEFPDRISDALLILGLGYGFGEPTLAWAATAAAFLTSYLRELGVNCGLAADFSGPMAKQHRMALLTIMSIFAAFASLFYPASVLIKLTLWILTIGTFYTALSRAFRLRGNLMYQSK